MSEYPCTGWTRRKNLTVSIADIGAEGTKKGCQAAVKLISFSELDILFPA